MTTPKLELLELVWLQDIRRGTRKFTVNSDPMIMKLMKVGLVFESSTDKTIHLTFLGEAVLKNNTPFEFNSYGGNHFSGHREQYPIPDIL